MAQILILYTTVFQRTDLVSKSEKIFDFLRNFLSEMCQYKTLMDVYFKLGEFLCH